MGMYSNPPRQAIQIMQGWVGGILLPIIFFFSCRSEEAKPETGNGSDWSKLGPGGGGATFFPTFSYHTEKEFLVRCDMTGSYLTKDGGESYHQINFPNGANSFAFDPHDNTTIYIGSSSLNRSTDGGKTWEQIFPVKEEIVSEKYEGDHANYSFKTVSTSLYNSESGDINSIYTFNKRSNAVIEKVLPPAMVPAFSFSGGTVKDSEQVILYALHHDQSKAIEEEFGYTTLWTSLDNGATWKKIDDKTINNDRYKITPSYSMVSCPEFDAQHAYLVCNRYEEKTGKQSIHWYGALKTDDSGNWNWVWKGGGGSGQYGVKDGIGVSNLEDAWSEEAFGGEYIRLMDVGF